MIVRRGKFRRTLGMAASALPTLGDFVRGLWRTRGKNRWLVPLIVFLCMTGLLLLLAGSVEAIAPFIYSIF